MATVLCFGDIELHLDSGELFRAGERVKLQPQPAKVLEVLASRSGEVVSREEIRKLVWGEETFVDLDASLNFCIKQIRQALGDSALAPRFVETIPRRGYRFLVPVQTRSRIAPEPSLPAETPVEAPVPPAIATAPPDRPRQRFRLLGLSAAALALVLVALALVTAMRRPGSQEPERARAPRAVPPAAREHYLKAVYAFRGDPAKGLEEMKKALLLAPDYAEAHAMLAWFEVRADSRPESVLPQAEITARKAVELDPDLARAHLALGEVLLKYKLDWEGSERELRRAVELDPNLAEAWHALATPLAGLGRHEEAIAAARRARETDPASMLVNADLAWFYYLSRQYDEAVRQAASALELKASKEKEAPLSAEDRMYFRWAWRVILYSSLQTGDQRAQIEAARALVEIYGGAAAAAKISRLEEFWPWERELMLRIIADHPGAFPLDGLVANSVGAGRPDLAFSYLEEACRRKWPNLLLTAAADPLYDPLRGDPRFTRFLDCIRLPADAPSRRGLPAAGEP